MSANHRPGDKQAGQLSTHLDEAMGVSRRQESRVTIEGHGLHGGVMPKQHMRVTAIQQRPELEREHPANSGAARVCEATRSHDMKGGQHVL